MSYRPGTCCGVCPEIIGGGFDCTCDANPRCPIYRRQSAMRAAYRAKTRRRKP